MTKFRARTLHPLAWWFWGISLAISTSRTANPWMLGIIITSALLVAFLRKTNDPWSKALIIGIQIAVIALTLRMMIAIFFSVPGQGKILFTIPRVHLPEWLAGIYLGGSVTWERLSFVLLESTTIFALVISIAAASSLANPKQTLRALPGILHEAGVALIIATTLIPHFATSLNRISEARKLRGDTSRFGFKRTLIPLFEEALERALIMAESMESRGYGRVGAKKNSLVATLLLAFGVISLLLALIEMLIGMEYRVLLISALVCIVIALFLSNQKNPRTKYRPLPWRLQEVLVLIFGCATIILVGFTYSPLLLLCILALALSPLAFTSRSVSIL